MVLVFHSKRYFNPIYCVCLFLIGSFSILYYLFLGIEKNHDDATTADDDVAIVCLVLTRPYQLDSKASVVFQTWGKRCDRIHFATPRTEQTASIALPILETDIQSETDDTRKMATKLFTALDKLYTLYSTSAGSSYEWFFICDDDTYVIVENLKRFIAEIKQKNPKTHTHETYGYNFESDFHSGGAGILLHRHVLNEFVENHEIKCKGFTMGPGDVMLAKCLKQMGINLGQSRDENNMDRFLPLSLYENWVINEDSKVTVNCCSEKIISMHYINTKEMLKLDTLLYKIKISSK